MIYGKQQTEICLLGPKGHHGPSEEDLNHSQYVKSNDVSPVKKVGRIKFKINLTKLCATSYIF